MIRIGQKYAHYKDVQHRKLGHITTTSCEGICLLGRAHVKKADILGLLGSLMNNQKLVEIELVCGHKRQCFTKSRKTLHGWYCKICDKYVDRKVA